MDIISRYIREQKRYSKEDLKRIFNLDNDSFKPFVKDLKVCGVLKVVKNTQEQKNLSDLIDEDVEIVDIDFSNEEYFYVFTYVGVLVVKNIVIKCFPKYILSKEEPLEELQEVLKVIRKYNSKEQQIINLYNGYDEEKKFNFLAISLYILNDYHDNGIYTNQQDIVETNGEGEILWDRTINDTFALIVHKKPFYTELQTLNVINDETDYITRLHKFIITDCCKKLKKANLLDLFEIEEIDLSDEEQEFFGERDYILYRLERELNVQFITHKQILLKTLYAYIAHNQSFMDDLDLSLYGTNSFNMVWEKVCAEVFDNNLSTKLKKLNLPEGLHKDYVINKNSTLSEIIKKPLWLPLGFEDDFHEAKRTLTPDLISVYEVKEGLCFGIFDAKYYNIVLTKEDLLNSPGVGDITKQYLYQLAYNDFIRKHGFVSVINAFLMPTEKESSELIGEAKMEILEGLSDPPLVNILVVKLFARRIYQKYLSGKKLDINKEFEFF